MVSHAVASCGPKAWVQVSTVRAETSMPRSLRRDLPGRERVAQVPADRGDDDLRRPTVAREGAAGGVGEVTMAAGEALTASAIEPIVRIGGLLTGRAGGHRPNLLLTPQDFAHSSRALARVPQLRLEEPAGQARLTVSTTFPVFCSVSTYLVASTMASNG